MGDWRPFVFGGMASVAAECGTFPIDTTKTRLQIQGQQINGSNLTLKYRGMFHTAFRVSKEEGLIKLYSGLKPAVLRQATYGTIKIGIYHSMKKIFFTDVQDERLDVNVFCGIVAGVVASSMANPTDVLKIRMQSQHKSFAAKGLTASFIDVYQNEGVKGLWRGVGPTANRAAVICGVELPIYDFAKKELINRHISGDNIYTHFIASFIAGLAGAIASNPIDVVKTRMMNQRNIAPSMSETSTTIYKSQFDCVCRTIKYEGISALYKGFIPNWLRLGPWNIIFFVTFEQLRKL